jgi:UDP-2,4-diacetamido-2,4,6-trideoxy-beta-L-altropyranose hydrolase
MGAASPNLLVLRADSSAQMGSGHVMRCLALAQEWKDAGGKAMCIMGVRAPEVELRLTAGGVEVLYIQTCIGSRQDAKETALIARQGGAGWIVTDGYQFGSDYQQAIKDEGLHLLSIDDYGHAQKYFADLVVNQNICATENLYLGREPYTRLLLGTRFVLLRNEFRSRKEKTRKTTEAARKILVTMGGADQANVSLQVLQALQKVDVPDVETKIILGPSNPLLKTLEATVARCFPKGSVGVLKNVSNMEEPMGWADLAVSGGGTTCWELAFMGVPNVILILAENQRPIAEKLDSMGIAINLGSYDHVSPSHLSQTINRLLLSTETRKRLVSNGKDLIDGEGVERVLMHMEGERIRLRKLREEDRRLIWEWANDPEVRRASFSSDPISWEEHTKWFASKFHLSRCFFYIPVDSDDVPIGQVRFDAEDHEADISISLERRYRGKDYGNRVIQLASRKLFSSSDVTMIHAYIKEENEVSTYAFLKAGFTRKGITQVNGRQAFHLTLRKPELA